MICFGINCFGKYFPLLWDYSLNFFLNEVHWCLNPNLGKWKEPEDHSPWQSCKDAHPGEFLYRSMGETWMLSVASVARLGLPLGDLSASCGCACFLLEEVSKEKHPRKRIRRH